MGSAGRPGRKLLHRAARAVAVRPSSVSRSPAGAVTTQAFIWLTAWVRALTAESLVLLSMRIISISPSLDLGVALATPASTARAAVSASVRSLLPFRYRVDRSGRLTSTTVKPRPLRNRASPSP